MVTNQATLVINQPVEHVFSFVTRFENRPKWCQGTLESKHTFEVTMDMSHMRDSPVSASSKAALEGDYHAKMAA